ncbi:small conductance mechanosensitive channel [Pedobacter sp. UYP30]|uniref:mechanosensitive ion channel family protein n=1 Tax=Pedobacter sp. UYP30 TaxID=1756400 RepID=UPI003391E841
MNFNINDSTKLITDKLSLWLKELIKLLPNILLAVVVTVIGFFVAKYIHKLATKLIGKLSNNHTLNSLFSSIIYIFFLGIVIFIALSILQLDKAITTILGGAGLLGLAFAFAFQDIAANFMSGIFISFRRPIRIGNIVKIKDFMGKIESINLRDTTIRTFQGQMVIIPNKEVFQNPIENFSMLGKRRFDLSVGVSYGEDLERVMQITMDAVKDIEGLVKGEKTTMFFNEFADSSINYTIRFWVNSLEQPEYLKVGSDAIIKIKKAYDANDIMIPYPIRTLDFGIKGGQTLSEMEVNLQQKS